MNSGAPEGLSIRHLAKYRKLCYKHLTFLYCFNENIITLIIATSNKINNILTKSTDQYLLQVQHNSSNFLYMFLLLKSEIEYHILSEINNYAQLISQGIILI